MAEIIANPKKTHVGCGETLIEIEFADRISGRRYCPKHPDQEEYLCTY